jgi:chaperonin GroEL (HSP60 family)
VLACGACILAVLEEASAADGIAADLLLLSCAGGVVDTYESFVWEPALVKINAITAATEAACLVCACFGAFPDNNVH